LAYGYLICSYLFCGTLRALCQQLVYGLRQSTPLDWKDTAHMIILWPAYAFRHSQAGRT
jgi:hypothetical protein